MFYTIHPRFLLNGQPLSKEARRQAFDWIKGDTLRAQWFDSESAAQKVLSSAPKEIQDRLSVCQTCYI